MRSVLNNALPIATAFSAFIITGSSFSSFALALSPSKAPQLAPHRAVYEMTLGEAARASGVVGVKGRLVFEFSGNACEGYTQNMRFVTQVIDRRGKSTLTDLRSSSWEDGDGKRFRFNSHHYRDRKLKETVKGDAIRSAANSDVAVALSRPKPMKLKFSANVLFPNQHSISVLKHALSGNNVLQAQVYDGSDKGEKVYDTTTIIGKPRITTTDDLPKTIANLARLKSQPSWPVAISYFELKKSKDTGKNTGKNSGSGEELPVYELGFRIYANGVSRKLLINYGDFSIRGTLKEIEFFKADECEKESGD